MTPDPACPNMASLKKNDPRIVCKVNDAGHSLNRCPQNHEHIGVRTGRARFLTPTLRSATAMEMLILPTLMGPRQDMIMLHQKMTRKWGIGWGLGTSQLKDHFILRNFGCYIPSLKTQIRWMKIPLKNTTVVCKKSWWHWSKHPMFGIFTHIWLIFMVNFGKCR